jgi:hypothetical protein
MLSYFNIGDSKKSEGLRARVAVRGEPERRGVNPVPGTSGLNRPSTGVPGDSSLERRNDLNTVPATVRAIHTVTKAFTLKFLKPSGASTRKKKRKKRQTPRISMIISERALMDC